MMYWISHRIKEVRNYEKRAKALDDEVYAAALNVWDETTSFHIIESNVAITTLAARLKAVVDPRTDIVVIRNLNSKSAKYFGPLKKELMLNYLMPYATRV